MRCARCNLSLDPARLASGARSCVCGADLELPDEEPRARPSPAAFDAPAVDEAVTYRTAQPTPALPLELAGVGEGRPCPRCETALVYAFQASRDLHECARCLGVFVDVGVLEVLVDEARNAHTTVISPRAPAETVRAGRSLDDYARCPSCRTLMKRVVFGRRSGVVVDVCGAHGTWFDAGELEKALAFEASGGAERVARAERLEQRMHQDPLVAVARGADAAKRMQDARAAATAQRRFGGHTSFLDWLERFRGT